MTVSASNAAPRLFLAPELLGPAARYRAMALHAPAAVDCSLHFDKRRKSFHRFTIADTRGPLAVTIPIAKPASHSTATYADILISDHSPWWLTMMTALESAYGRTPFFEFYADDFAPLIGPHRVGTPMATLCRDLDALVCRLLAIPAPARLPAAHAHASAQSASATFSAPEPLFDSALSFSDGQPSTAPEPPGLDLRRSGEEALAPYALAAPYWQVRAASLGFIPGLSIVDLLFNLGPEAQLLIHAPL